MILGKYSFGVGDRFGHQGKAQLEAVAKAKEQGLDITTLWNKSHREHTIIGTSPAEVRVEADDAVKSLAWDRSYYVDADHIGLANVGLAMLMSLSNRAISLRLTLRISLRPGRWKQT